MSARRSWRKLVNAVMFFITGLCAAAAVFILLFILGYLVYFGGRSLNWSFLTELPKPVGESGGGMANAIVGTGKLLLLAALIGVPIGLLGGIYTAEFSGRIAAWLVRYTADLLSGVPSIVIGIFAYTLVVIPMRHFSILAGGIALGIMVIPATIRSTDQFLRSVPSTLREGALALGVSYWRAVATVVLPAALRGVITGSILALARVAGETAPLLFTAFSNRYWSPGWSQPTASLPVMIYTYAISPYDDWRRQAWAAALILLLLMLAINITVRYLLSSGKRMHS